MVVFIVCFPATVTAAQTSDTVCLASVSVCTQPDIQEQLVTTEIVGEILKEKNQATIQDDNSELT